jgi:ribosomal protein S26
VCKETWLPKHPQKEKQQKKYLIKGNMDQNFIVEFQKDFFFNYYKQSKVKTSKSFCVLCQNHIRTASFAKNKL